MAPAAEEAQPEISPAMKRLILLTIAVTTGAGTLGTAFLPYLMVQHPALLLASGADGRNIVLVAPQLDCWLVLLIGVPRRVLAMLGTYGLGLLYGRRLIAWSSSKMPRLGRVMAWVERLFLRFRRSVILIWPTYSSSALAGVTRTSLGLYLPWMVLGQVGYVVVAYYIGAGLSEWTRMLMDWVSRHVWEATAVCVLAVSAQQVVSYLRRRRERSRPQGDAPEGEPSPPPTEA